MSWIAFGVFFWILIMGLILIFLAGASTDEA